MVLAVEMLGLMGKILVMELVERVVTILAI